MDYDSISVEAVSDLISGLQHFTVFSGMRICGQPDEIHSDTGERVNHKADERSHREQIPILSKHRKETLDDLLRIALDSAIEASALNTAKTWECMRATKIEHIAKNSCLQHSCYFDRIEGYY